jgi:hypothetical protein
VGVVVQTGHIPDILNPGEDWHDAIMHRKAVILRRRGNERVDSGAAGGLARLSWLRTLEVCGGGRSVPTGRNRSRGGQSQDSRPLCHPSDEDLSPGAPGLRTSSLAILMSSLPGGKRLMDFAESQVSEERPGASGYGTISQIAGGRHGDEKPAASGRVYQD